MKKPWKDWINEHFGHLLCKDAEAVSTLGKSGFKESTDFTMPLAPRYLFIKHEYLKCTGGYTSRIYIFIF